MDGNIHLIVKSRQGIVLDEQIKALSSSNKIGRFDVLANHENFISLIGQDLTLETVKGEKKQLHVDNGILKVRENKIEVYLGVKK